MLNWLKLYKQELIKNPPQVIFPSFEFSARPLINDKKI